MRQGDYDKSTLVSGDSARTASFNSDAEDVQPYIKLWAYLNVTAVSGTSPTLDITIEESPDGIEWFDSGYSFTQVTSAEKQRLVMDAIGGYHLRAVCTIGGTSPSFTFSLDMVGKQN